MMSQYDVGVEQEDGLGKQRRCCDIARPQLGRVFAIVPSPPPSFISSRLHPLICHAFTCLRSESHEQSRPIAELSQRLRFR